ncbi:general substrate transporter [Colletotrichum zoysiae]|uniref:General substrate transporter n=1 Tax=Colletotrichum zoysiae TaxID=1216348 RepID=A0AAD9H468_9PEZI|nr:general substrate transporter [Colletotrichum zoysiae]
MHDLHKKSSDHNGHAVAETIESADSPHVGLVLPSNLTCISYGPTGLRGILQSPYVFSAALIASMGGFSFGYDQGVISIINVMPQFHRVFPEAKSGFGKGFMTGMLELGAFIGCVFMPWLADTISRKRALSAVVVVFNIGAILQTAAVNYEMLVLGRTIGGIGVGALAMGAPLYISEISPPNLRGTLLVLESVSIVLGVVVSFWITYGARGLSGEVAFRLPFGLQMVSATLVGIGINCFPYSPRWLAMIDRKDEALASLAKLRRLPANDERVQQEFESIVAETRYQQTVLKRRHPNARGFTLEVKTWVDLFSLKLWRRVIVGCGVMAFQQFSGINAFIYYAPTLFQTLGQDYEMSLIMSGVFNMLQLAAVSVCFLIIDKVGRRPLAIFGGAGGCISWGIMAALVGVYSKVWQSHTDAGWAAVAMAFLFILIYGCTYAPLGWAVPSEVFPSAMRSKGVALSTSTNWICNFIVGVITPPMLDSWGFGTYIFYGGWCGLSVIWAWFFLVETKGKTLEEMDEVFGDNIVKEERDQVAFEASERFWEASCR